MNVEIENLAPQFTSEILPELAFASYTELQFLQTDSTIRVQGSMAFPAQSIIEEFTGWLASQTGKSVTADVTLNVKRDPAFGKIKHIVLVASGKGGVGKSTTAVNLSLALAQEGAKVGLLDADIYGPSIPMMTGLTGQVPEQNAEGKMVPLSAHGVSVNSIGFLIPAEKAAVWRGPMASQALSQLIADTAWGELDYLIVDLPPGTGDIQLTLSQKFSCNGSVIVTTPQDIALADAEKGIAMFEKVNIPVLGLIENMSWFNCSACGNQEYIFGQDGANSLAHRYGVNVLGQLPLVPEVRAGADEGKPVVSQDGNPVAPLYHAIAINLAKTLYAIDESDSSVNIQQPVIQLSDD